jgi:hypothetical protein
VPEQDRARAALALSSSVRGGCAAFHALHITLRGLGFRTPV